MIGRRRAGFGLLLIGLGLAAIGTVGLLSGRGTGPTGVAAQPSASLVAAVSAGAAAPSLGPSAGFPASPSGAGASPPSSPPAPTATAGTAAVVTAFLDELVAAIRGGSVGAMTSRLHAAVIERYGADRCAAEMATRPADTTYTIEVLDVLPSAPWAYETDGRSTTITGVTTVRARVTAQGAVTERDLHVAIVDGIVRWFTDCGTPAGQ